MTAEAREWPACLLGKRKDEFCLGGDGSVSSGLLGAILVLLLCSAILAGFIHTSKGRGKGYIAGVRYAGLDDDDDAGSREPVRSDGRHRQSRDLSRDFTRNHVCDKEKNRGMEG